MPALYVKPYVKRQKNDATDAEAICEAVTRPTMRFVPVKSQEQQSVLMLHRVRELLIRQRTMLVNALRGHLAEFGIATRQGFAGVGTLIALVEDQDAKLLPPLAQAALLPIVRQLREVTRRSARWTARFMHGTVAMNSADASRQFLESAQSLQARSLRP